MARKVSNCKNRAAISYHAMLNWIEKAEQYKGQPESRLFIRNAETYAKSLLHRDATMDMSAALIRIERLKQSIL